MAGKRAWQAAGGVFSGSFLPESPLSLGGELGRPLIPRHKRRGEPSARHRKARISGLTLSKQRLPSGVFSPNQWNFFSSSFRFTDKLSIKCRVSISSLSPTPASPVTAVLLSREHFLQQLNPCRSLLLIQVHIYIRAHSLCCGSLDFDRQTVMCSLFQQRTEHFTALTRRGSACLSPTPSPTTNLPIVFKL